MIFDGHSDIFTDVTVRRLKGETQVLKKSPSASFKKGQHRRRLLCSVD